jgi:hypothetical protein
VRVADERERRARVFRAREGGEGEVARGGVWVGGGHEGERERCEAGVRARDAGAGGGEGEVARADESERERAEAAEGGEAFRDGVLSWVEVNMNIKRT